MDDAIEVARNYEECYNCRAGERQVNAIKRINYSKVQFPKKMRSKEFGYKKQSRHEKFNREKLYQKGNKFSNQQSRQPTCFTCNKKGHIAKNCRMKQMAHKSNIVKSGRR